jgi:CelD/BcsL family acetyltransferase involved in cellulose biosynthesis
LQVELIQRAPDIPLQRLQWNALVSGSATNSIFQTYEWFDSWWSEFGSGYKLYFLVLREADDIVGFAPLMTSASGAERQLQFVGASHADYSDIVVAPALHARGITAILDFLKSRSFEWNSLFIRNLPDASPTAAALRRNGMHGVRWGVTRCPALQIAGRREQIESQLAKYSLRRPTDWFSKHGKLRFQFLESSGEVAGYLPAFFDQHVARWQGSSSPSRFTEPAQRRFFERLAEQMRMAGWLSFLVVEFDGELLACHFGFEYANKLVWYKPSFNPLFRQRSPGLVLIRHLIRHAADVGLEELDFTIGDEAFKSRFASTRRSNIDLAIYARRSAFFSAFLSCSVRRVAAISFERLRMFARAAPQGHDS